MSIIEKFLNRIMQVLDNIKYGKCGRKSKIIKPMRIIGKRRIFLGENVRILNNARLETIRIWSGKVLNGQLHIGDHTSIEQNCHIIAANYVGIGKDCVISSFVYISDCSHNYSPYSSIMESELEVKKTVIGDHCFIGVGACIMPGVILGDNVVVGANSVVTKNVPSNAIVAGVPAKIIKRWEFSK